MRSFPFGYCSIAVKGIGGSERRLILMLGGAALCLKIKSKVLTRVASLSLEVIRHGKTVVKFGS